MAQPQLIIPSQSHRPRPPVPVFGQDKVDRHIMKQGATMDQNPASGSKTTTVLSNDVSALSARRRESPNRRAILSPVSVNHASRTTTIQKKFDTKNSRTSLHHSIPRPAPIPDVFFTATPEHPSTSHSASATTSIFSSKRSRDQVGILPAPKRQRTDKDTLEACAGKHKAEEEKWRSKWVKIFPTLVFHFEIGSDQAQRKALMSRVTEMGARVDQFLSNRVTHVIVKHLPSPSKPKSRPDLSRNHLIAREASKNPFLDDTGATDLVKKAEALNMKVWSEDKLSSILDKLAPTQLNNSKDSLHTLLEDEKIHGTRERDSSAPRPDYYYFKPGSKYLLIEDATGRHRTIMTKEYGLNPKDSATTEWPTLFETFLRPSSGNHSVTSVHETRDRAWALYVDCRSFKGERPPDLRTPQQEWSRPGMSAAPDVSESMPYIHASGNSVQITSNIASTSTTSNSPGVFTGPGLGILKDRAISNLSKRIQVLKGNAHLAASKSRQNSMQLQAAASRGVISKSTSAAPAAKKTLMTQSQVIRMLRQVRGPVREEPVPKEERIKNREKVDAGLKGREQETAAGYCENCRLRYTDLSAHVSSKKHRRFATDSNNFKSLDELLNVLQRPLNPYHFPPDKEVCWNSHEKDDYCPTCSDLSPTVCVVEQRLQADEMAGEYEDIERLGLSSSDKLDTLAAEDGGEVGCDLEVI